MALAFIERGHAPSMGCGRFGAALHCAQALSCAGVYASLVVCTCSKDECLLVPWAPLSCSLARSSLELALGWSSCFFLTSVNLHSRSDLTYYRCSYFKHAITFPKTGLLRQARLLCLKPAWYGSCVYLQQKASGHCNNNTIVADGHTASNAPDLFRPPKLSGAGPG